MHTKTAPQFGQHSAAAQGNHRWAIAVVNHAKPAQMLEVSYFPHFGTELAGQQRLQWPAKRPSEPRHV